MPEVNVLYAVTAAVLLGLVGWVVYVLASAKEPWAREVPAGASPPLADLPPVEPAAAPVLAPTPADDAKAAPSERDDAQP